jgi:adenine-specific DNA-methyltransferase
MSEVKKRLNYIGSKFQLLDWITTQISECLQLESSSFQNLLIGDFFSGTGIVSYHFRQLGCSVYSNDRELYSFIISYAMNQSVYTERCRTLIEEFNSELKEESIHLKPGFITLHYAPYDKNERMFFTIENALRIDYFRHRIEEVKTQITESEYYFLLASLLVCADNVSNIPAVYGCYLKKFKAKALHLIILSPLHTLTNKASPHNQVWNKDICELNWNIETVLDFIYLDPPYNERQYSKNYFVLNMIAMNPDETRELKGKTGIPTDCFLSSFCQKSKVKKTFESLLQHLNRKTKHIFMSYSSESLLKKEEVIQLMKKYGEVKVIEREYKRFKSFEYNKDISIQEYLFCLKIKTE